MLKPPRYRRKLGVAASDTTDLGGLTHKAWSCRLLGYAGDTNYWLVRRTDGVIFKANNVVFNEEIPHQTPGASRDHTETSQGLTPPVEQPMVDRIDPETNESMGVEAIDAGGNIFEPSHGTAPSGSANSTNWRAALQQSAAAALNELATYPLDDEPMLNYPQSLNSPETLSGSPYDNDHGADKESAPTAAGSSPGAGEAAEADTSRNALRQHQAPIAAQQAPNAARQARKRSLQDSSNREPSPRRLRSVSARRVRWDLNTETPIDDSESDSTGITTPQQDSPFETPEDTAEEIAVEAAGGTIGPVGAPDETPLYDEDTVVVQMRPAEQQPSRFAMMAHRVNQEPEPPNLQSARADPQWPRWKEAMEDELASLKGNDVWSLVDPPLRRRVLSGKWVYKLKTDG